MPRRRRSLFYLLAILLPWWCHLILAVLVWPLSALLVDYFGSAAPASTVRLVLAQVLAQLIPLAAPILALVFCSLFAISAFRCWRRGKLFRSQTSLQSVRNLSWRNFERYVGEIYRRKGYVIEETGFGGADGGIDLIVRKNDAKFLVQCKTWRTKKVGVHVVRELLGVVEEHGAAGGKLVISGEFTADAWKYAEQPKLELIDGEKLVSLVGRMKGMSVSPEGEEASLTDLGAPSCPRCDSPMVERTAKKGRYAGQTFWGCSRYPNCKGIRA